VLVCRAVKTELPGRLEKSSDAIVRLTASAICGTDLHFIRGTLTGMKSGTIPGHEGVGVIEEVGDDVRNLRGGDRVVIPSTIGCGYCAYCRAGYYSECDFANPNGPDAGTGLLRRPCEQWSLPWNAGRKVRVPYANVGLVQPLKHDLRETIGSLVMRPLRYWLGRWMLWLRREHLPSSASIRMRCEAPPWVVR
jgi:threonine dehydrogenase-like Zn-dependent dehydrogenase